MLQVVDHLEDIRRAFARVRMLTKAGGWCPIEFDDRASIMARALGSGFSRCVRCAGCLPTTVLRRVPVAIRASTRRPCRFALALQSRMADRPHCARALGRGKFQRVRSCAVRGCDVT